MSNCLVDLFSLQPQVSYAFLYTYLRQMAIHLRTAISKFDEKERKISDVYNWQFVNCLRMIACVLSKECKLGENGSPSTSPLFPLIYPFIQLCFSLIDYVPTVRFFPLRFFIIKLLNTVAAATGVFVPSAAQLLTVLQLDSSSKKKQHLIKGTFSFSHALHASKTAIQSRMYSDYSFTEMNSLLLQYFAIYAYSVAFPELIVPVVMQLKKAVKNFTKSDNVKTMRNLSSLVVQLELNAKWVVSKRNELAEAPKDIKDIFTLKKFGVAPLVEFAERSQRIFCSILYCIQTKILV